MRISRYNYIKELKNHGGIVMFDKTEKLVLAVDGMHCNHCKARVEAAIKAVKGVRSAEADLASATAEVVFVPAKVQPEAIAEAVCAIGFEAKVK